MKVKFLGTSHGLPMKGRHCQSILIQTENGDYMIDAGAPVLDILSNDGYDLTRLKAIFVTHMHSDHMMGIADIICAASWYYKDMNFKVFLPEQRGIDEIRSFCAMLLYNSYDTDRITYNLYEEGMIYDDGNFKITAYHTDHMDATSDIAYGFMAEAEGQKVYITGDMHRTLKDFREQLYKENVNLLIAECAHFTPEALCDKLKKCRTNAAAIVHVFPLRVYDELKKLEKELPFKMLYPKDGDEYEISQY